MEVHHHSSETGLHTGKRFKHYLFEFFMLFLAVFCGFLAEYQLEHSIEKQKAKEYALSLYGDIASDTITFNQTIGRLNTCVKNIDTLIKLLDNKEEIEKNTPAIYHYSIYAFIFPQNKPNESTIQQLLSSGSLRYFRSNPLIDSIKSYSNEIQLFNIFSADIGSMNVEFRKVQAKVLEINPLIDSATHNNFFSGENSGFVSLVFPDKAQLITTDPPMTKEYANWCALKKF
ncbi:MAG: hypothetical protein JST10_04850 [Bacteroidetes bacterium]|nr:hypothetical protein [Bacteroidota bacterium]MBS1631882.1 hypothetical protein [Bacteroidota bacterium]